MHIYFLIRSLETGGAERQLVELVKNINPARYIVTVAMFYDLGHFRQELQGLNHVRLVSLNKSGRWDTMPFFLRLIQEIRASDAQIIHGYLDVANIYALLAGRFTNRKVVFGVRNTNMDFSRYDWTAFATYRLSAWLSHFANQVIYNSQAGLAYHIENGFSPRNGLVIPNGIDVNRFKGDAESRKRLRAEWHIADNELLVGHVGRLDPMKDHSNFLQAAAKIKEKIPQANFVCVGAGPPEKQAELQQMSSLLGLEDRVRWTGVQRDMVAVYNALDILVNSSFTESFPNVVAEAMACKVPCVVTDAGDSALIVAGTGRVVPPGDPAALSEAMLEFLSLPARQREAYGVRARQRILEQFSVEKMTIATEQVLSMLIEAD